jgi:hypothetical protein
VVVKRDVLSWPFLSDAQEAMRSDVVAVIEFKARYQGSCYYMLVP